MTRLARSLRRTPAPAAPSRARSVVPDPTTWAEAHTPRMLADLAARIGADPVR